MSKDLPRTSHRGYSNPYSIRYAGSQRDRFGVDKRQEIRMMMLDNNDHEDYPENFTGEWYVLAGHLDRVFSFYLFSDGPSSD